MPKKYYKTFLRLAALCVCALDVSADISIPAAIGGVSPNGNGVATNPYTYSYSSAALGLGTDNIINTDLVSTNGCTVFTNITDLTCGTGGSFDFSGTNGHRPYLRIYASGDINAASIDTHGNINYAGGAVTVKSSAGDVNIASLITTGSVNTAGGQVLIDAGGSVDVAGIINKAGKSATSVAVTGTVVNVGGAIVTWGLKSSSGPVDLSSTAGGITINGMIDTSCGQGAGGAVILMSSDAVSVVGGIKTVGTRNNGGYVNINASAVTVGGVIDSHAVEFKGTEQSGGAIYINADGDVTLNAISTTSVRDDPVTWGVGGDIDILSTAGNIEIVSNITAYASSGTNGNLTISAPNGTITLGNLNITNLNTITLDAKYNGLVITGDIDGLTIAGNTVKGGFKSDSLSGDILYFEDMNTDEPLIGDYVILDKDTGESTGYLLATKFPPATVIMVR